jgi:hypothetical protein
MRLNSRMRRRRGHSSALFIPVGASAPSAAGRLMGRFALPVAAEWNHRNLPAGDYRFVVSSSDSRASVYVRGDDGAAVFFASSIEWSSSEPGGLLCLVYDECGYRVRSLKLRDTKRILYFDARRPRLVPLDTGQWPGVLYISLVNA